jgi:hypothetical protein
MTPLWRDARIHGLHNAAIKTGAPWCRKWEGRRRCQGEGAPFGMKREPFYAVRLGLELREHDARGQPDVLWLRKRQARTVRLCAQSKRYA